MSDTFDRLAERLTDNPFFFSYYLRLHREARGLDWDAQALWLGISGDKLIDLALCRCPDWRRPGHVSRIAEGCNRFSRLESLRWATSSWRERRSVAAGAVILILLHERRVNWFSRCNW
jgi:hypothetical protein